MNNRVNKQLNNLLPFRNNARVEKWARYKVYGGAWSEETTVKYKSNGRIILKCNLDAYRPPWIEIKWIKTRSNIMNCVKQNKISFNKDKGYFGKRSNCGVSITRYVWISLNSVYRNESPSVQKSLLAPPGCCLGRARWSDGLWLLDSDGMETLAEGHSLE